MAAEGLFLIGGFIADLFGADATMQAARMKAREIREEADYEREIAIDNAALARENKQDAIEAGDLEASMIEGARRKYRGAQRAALGASGVDAGFGTAAAIGIETDKAAEMDKITAKNNAWRVAYGFEREAIQYEKHAARVSLASERKAKAVMAAGSMDALGQVIGGIGKLGIGASKLPDAGSALSVAETTKSVQRRPLRGYN